MAVRTCILNNLQKLESVFLAIRAVLMNHIFSLKFENFDQKYLIFQQRPIPKIVLSLEASHEILPNCILESTSFKCVHVYALAG